VYFGFADMTCSEQGRVCSPLFQCDGDDAAGAICKGVPVIFIYLFIFPTGVFSFGAHLVCCSTSIFVMIFLAIYGFYHYSTTILAILEKL
jgi:hypothetical protein